MQHKREKLNSAIREAAGEYLASKRFENAMVTVTSVNIEGNLSKATVFVTVYPEKENEKVLRKINRGRGLFAKHVKTKTRIINIPYFNFEIDKGEMHRQRIDDISKDI